MGIFFKFLLVNFITNLQGSCITITEMKITKLCRALLINSMISIFLLNQISGSKFFLNKSGCKIPKTPNFKEFS